MTNAMSQSYELNVTRWETNYPGWKLTARYNEPGFVAHRRDGKGSPLVAATLDALAALVDSMHDPSEGL